MRLAPARSPGASRVMSDRLASTVTAHRRRPRRGVGDGELQQACVPVVDHPVLRPGQPRREPAAHRAAAAAEVVDHEAAGRGEVPREALGELGRARRRVGRLAQDEPLRADRDAARATHPRRSREDAGDDGRRRRPPAQRRAPLAGGPAQAPAQPGVAEPGPQRGAEGRRVAGRDEQPRPGTVLPVPERLGHPADLGCEDRQAAGEGLGDDHAVRLGVRGEHEQIRGGVRAVEPGAGARSQEAHPVAQPARARRRRRRRTPGRGPGCPRTRSARTSCVAVASASSSTSCPLSRVTGATQSSASPAALPGARPAASTPGSATCTRSAGSAYSSPSRRRVHALVVTTAAAAARTSRSRRGDLVIQRAVAQRHVHQDDLPQPARVRHERLGGGGRDQPVEQDHGAVRNPPDRACQGGVPRGAGSRPGAGHRVLVHRPAERGEPSADPAVVGVAAARPRGVVDSLGHDDVDLRHSGRS